MAWGFLIIGYVLIIAAIKGREAIDSLFDLLKQDFTGDSNFFAWVTTIALLAMLGMVKSIRPVTDAFIFLIFVVIFIGNRDLIAEFVRQVKAGTS